MRRQYRRICRQSKHLPYINRDLLEVSRKTEVFGAILRQTNFHGVRDTLGIFEYSTITQLRQKYVYNYYMKLKCEYLVYMPRIGSQDYINMISEIGDNNILFLQIAGRSQKQRMMRDANAWNKFEYIELSDSQRFAEKFTTLIRMDNTITKEEHYFRNKLNRVPETIKEADMLVAKKLWYKVDKEKAALHQKGEYENLKYMSRPEGMYEAIYNTGTDLLVTDPDVMGSFNYAGGYDDDISEYLPHLTYDIIPWIKYGNTPDDKTTIEWRKQETISSMPAVIRQFVELTIAYHGL